MNRIFHPETDANLPEIGGKGRNLFRLQQNHAEPEWFALPVSCFADFLSMNGLDEKIAELIDRVTDDSIGQIAEEIRSLILEADLQEELAEEIRSSLKSLPVDSYVSVRSSAADEDGAEHSFAGIHESYLYIRGTDAVCDHVLQVWASGYQERAIAYRRQNGLPLHPVQMAVIVQRMVTATASGVVFTADPTTRNPHRMTISALYGLGEGLVSAGLDADHVIYNRRDHTFSATVVPKPTRLILDEESGTGLKEALVEQSLQERAALTDEQLERLVQVAASIEKEYGMPQDIEFCFDADGNLFILQTRSITTMDVVGPCAGNRQIWDNSNIIESYSGVTSPMTFSFIRHAYAVVYDCFSQVMGIPRKVIQQNQQVYRNMLGLFEGQVYYNLPNWYRLVKQFPGYAYNKQFMESMMGVRHRVDGDAEDEKDAGFIKRYLVELPKLALLVMRMINRFLSLHRRVPEFNRHFDHYYDHWSALDFNKLPPHELMQIYQDMEQHLLRNWKTPIINDFHVMLFYGLLKSVCSKWCGDEKGTLQNNLICGEGDIESTIPTRMLMKLAAEIQAVPELRDLFTSCSPEELLQEVPRRTDSGFILSSVKNYLDRYGFRCMNELKLEEPSLHETPGFVYQMLSNYVRMDASLLDIAAMQQRENRIRREAEQTAMSRLKGIRKPLFRFMLKHARNGVKNRENMRFARTKIYGLLRRLLNAVGSTLERESILDRADDIYYLTIDEVWDFVKGTAVTTNLRDLAALRKAEFDHYRKSESPPDDHFETYGMAYHRNTYRNPDQMTATVHEDGSLQGIGCSPGSVEGIARVIHSPRDDIRLNGEILVAARTDPGWVPLYPSVSGILIERGSILSHSAIVAREMGIPAIVGIPNLLESVPDGARIHMDAASGRVILGSDDTTSTLENA